MYDFSQACLVHSELYVGWMDGWDWVGMVIIGRHRGKEKAVCRDCSLLTKSDLNAVYSPPNDVYCLQGFLPEIVFIIAA